MYVLFGKVSGLHLQSSLKFCRPTEVVNPGNTLYVTGLSTRVTERDLEDHFNKEGKVS